MSEQLKYKEDFEIAKKRWDAFWANEIIDRPVLCVTAPKDGRELIGLPYMSGCSDGDVLGACKKYEKLASDTYFAGEAFPFYEFAFGADQFAAFVGGELEFHESTSWLHPSVTNWKDFNCQINEDSEGIYKKMLNVIETATEYSKGKFLISMLDLHSNLDALAALRGPQNLCYDLMDCPEEVEEALFKMRRFYSKVFEAIEHAGNMKERGYIGWSPTYCKERFAVIQCDFKGLISPDLVKKFVIPCLEEEAQYLKHSVYHYDGKEALVHIDDILAIPEIDVIQWVPGAGNPRTIEWMELLHKIQDAGKGLWIYDWTAEEIKTRYKELKPEKLVFSIRLESQSNADNFIECIEKSF